MSGRNVEAAGRIETAPAAEPLRFVFAGDSGAWADPTADGIFSQLVRQVAALRPPPLFFANLGDFAGLLDTERIVGNLHRAYAELDGAAPGAEIDLRAAIGDMVTFNGGPLRLPVMKFTDAAVHRLRDAAIRAKIIPPDTSGDVGDFFVGRNPE